MKAIRATPLGFDLETPINPTLTSWIFIKRTERLFGGSLTISNGETIKSARNTQEIKYKYLYKKKTYKIISKFVDKKWSLLCKLVAGKYDTFSGVVKYACHPGVGKIEIIHTHSLCEPLISIALGEHHVSLFRRNSHIDTDYYLSYCGYEIAELYNPTSLSLYELLMFKHNVWADGRSVMKTSIKFIMTMH